MEKIFGRTYNHIGDTNTDFIIKTRGLVKILYGKKFIDLLKDGKVNIESTPEIFKEVESISDINEDGIYLCDGSIYIKIGDTIVKISDGEDSTYVSYINKQNTSPDLKFLALNNIGLVFNDLSDAENAIINGFVYIINNRTFYTVSNGIFTELKFDAEFPNPYPKQLVIKREDSASGGALKLEGDGPQNGITISDHTNIYEESGNTYIENSTGKIILYTGDKAIFVVDKNGVTSFADIKTTGSFIGDNIHSENFLEGQTGFRLYYDSSTGKSILEVDLVIERDASSLNISIRTYSEGSLISNCYTEKEDPEDENSEEIFIFNTNTDLSLEKGDLVEILPYCIIQKGDTLVSLKVPILFYITENVDEDISAKLYPDDSVITFREEDIVYHSEELGDIIIKDEDFYSIFYRAQIYKVAKLGTLYETICTDYINNSISLQSNYTEIVDDKLVAHININTILGNVTTFIEETEPHPETTLGIFTNLLISNGGVFREPLEFEEDDLEVVNFPRYSHTLNNILCEKHQEADEEFENVIPTIKWIHDNSTKLNEPLDSINIQEVPDIRTLPTGYNIAIVYMGDHWEYQQVVSREDFDWLLELLEDNGLDIEKRTYTVNWFAEDTLLKLETVEEGGYASPPYILDHNGFRIKGWDFDYLNVAIVRDMNIHAILVETIIVTLHRLDMYGHGEIAGLDGNEKIYIDLDLQYHITAKNPGGGYIRAISGSNLVLSSDTLEINKMLIGEVSVKLSSDGRVLGYRLVWADKDYSYEGVDYFQVVFGTETKNVYPYDFFTGEYPVDPYWLDGDLSIRDVHIYPKWVTAYTATFYANTGYWQKNNDKPDTLIIHYRNGEQVYYPAYDNYIVNNDYTLLKPGHKIYLQEDGSYILNYTTSKDDNGDWEFKTDDSGNYIDLLTQPTAIESDCYLRFGWVADTEITVEVNPGELLWEDGTNDSKYLQIPAGTLLENLNFGKFEDPFDGVLDEILGLSELIKRWDVVRWNIFDWVNEPDYQVINNSICNSLGNILTADTDYKITAYSKYLKLALNDFDVALVYGALFNGYTSEGVYGIFDSDDEVSVECKTYNTISNYNVYTNVLFIIEYSFRLIIKTNSGLWYNEYWANSKHESDIKAIAPEENTVLAGICIEDKLKGTKLEFIPRNTLPLFNFTNTILPTLSYKCGINTVVTPIWKKQYGTIFDATEGELLTYILVDLNGEYNNLYYKAITVPYLEGEYAELPRILTPTRYNKYYNKLAYKRDRHVVYDTTVAEIDNTQTIIWNYTKSDIVYLFPSSAEENINVIYNTDADGNYTDTIIFYEVGGPNKNILMSGTYFFRVGWVLEKDAEQLTKLYSNGGTWKSSNIDEKVKEYGFGQDLTITRINFEMFPREKYRFNKWVIYKWNLFDWKEVNYKLNEDGTLYDENNNPVKAESDIEIHAKWDKQVFVSWNATNSYLKLSGEWSPELAEEDLPSYNDVKNPNEYLHGAYLNDECEVPTKYVLNPPEHYTLYEWRLDSRVGSGLGWDGKIFNPYNRQVSGIKDENHEVIGIEYPKKSFTVTGNTGLLPIFVPYVLEFTPPTIPAEGGEVIFKYRITYFDGSTSTYITPNNWKDNRGPHIQENWSVMSIRDDLDKDYNIRRKHSDHIILISDEDSIDGVGGNEGKDHPRNVTPDGWIEEKFTILKNDYIGGERKMWISFLLKGIDYKYELIYDDKYYINDFWSPEFELTQPSV